MNLTTFLILYIYPCIYKYIYRKLQQHNLILVLWVASISYFLKHYLNLFINLSGAGYWTQGFVLTFLLLGLGF
jgi:hypothetical protein